MVVRWMHWVVVEVVTMVESMAVLMAVGWVMSEGQGEVMWALVCWWLVVSGSGIMVVVFLPRIYFIVQKVLFNGLLTSL
jgi:hypothetical protein